MVENQMSPTVLVVDDNEDLVFLYKTALAQKGYEVVEARSSAEVMELLAKPEFVPAVVFIDIEMPDALGTHAIQYMRKNARFGETKIVVVTANDLYRDELAPLVNRFVVKPVAITLLTSLADELMP
jgi:two-component system response regulator MprA